MKPTLYARARRHATRRFGKDVWVPRIALEEAWRAGYDAAIRDTSKRAKK